MLRPPHVGIIGAGKCDEETYRLAEQMGRAVGKNGWTLVCGGLSGVMEGAAKGCSQAGGITVGILPGIDKNAANPFIRIPIPTGLGEARNVLVVRASDALLAISGGYGTLSEIGLALKTGKVVVGMRTWENISGVHYADGPAEALQKLTPFLQPA